MTKRCLVGAVCVAMLFSACGGEPDVVATSSPLAEGVSTTSNGAVASTSETNTSTSAAEEFSMDVCAVLTPEEAAVIVGDPATDNGTGVAPDGGITCEWMGPAGAPLVVSVWPGPEYFSTGDVYYDAEFVEEIGDLGDEAWINVTAGHVLWRQGDYTISVHKPLGGPTKEELLGVAYAIANRVG